MASKYWIKIYHEILDDPKMGRMPDHLWRRTLELFLIAGEQDEAGMLPKLGDMAYRLRVNDNELQNDLDELQELNIVHNSDGIWIVTKFAERQAPVSDAERMRRYRDRQHKEEYYGDASDMDTVTIRDEHCYESLTDKIRIDKNRIDTDKIRLDESAKTEYSAYQKIWEQETGKPIAGFTKFYKMVDGFIDAGVTPEIYRTAIQEQSKSDYPVRNPTSVETWAIGLVKNNKQEAKQEYTGPDGEIIKI